MAYRVSTGSTTDNFFFHPFFNRNFRQRSAIVALVTANPPFFNPLFLHVRLPALRTHKNAFHIMDFPCLFHASLSCDGGRGWHRQPRDCKIFSASLADDLMPPYAASGLTRLQCADRMPPCNDADHLRLSSSSSSRSPAIPWREMIRPCQG